MQCSEYGCYCSDPYGNPTGVMHSATYPLTSEECENEGGAILASSAGIVN